MTCEGIGRQCFRRLATVAKTVCRHLVGRVIRTTRRELSATTTTAAAAATAAAKGYMYTRAWWASQRETRRVASGKPSPGGGGGSRGRSELHGDAGGTENSIIATRRPFRAVAAASATPTGFLEFNYLGAKYMYKYTSTYTHTHTHTRPHTPTRTRECSRCVSMSYNNYYYHDLPLRDRRRATRATSSPSLPRAHLPHWTNRRRRTYNMI